MEQRELGKTGIKVSVICLGTMTYGAQNTEAEAHEQLDIALDGGVNFIDTAEIYPSPISAEKQGATETQIGNWLAKSGRRNDIVLASKVAGPGIEWIRKGTRLTKAHITKAAETSLRRLQTECIDLYQMHWPDRGANYFGRPLYAHDKNEDMTPLSESLSAMADLVKAGKIRAVGLSNETPWGLSECLRLARDEGLPRVASVQNPYNLLNRSYEVGMAEISARESCGLLPYSPLAFGVLSGKYLGGKTPRGARMTEEGQYYGNYYMNKRAQAATSAFADIAKKHGMTPAAMAVSFSVCQPFITSSIIGATTPEQLRENIAAGEIKLTPQCQSDINEATKAHGFYLTSA